jgi:biopolymer transport protein ExbD
MALRSRNKVSASFSMASMTDIVFLLLIFFMITSTLVHPTALKLLLPKSNNQVEASPRTSISITEDLQYFIEDERINPEELEQRLIQMLGNSEDAYIALHVDRSVQTQYVVEVMNIANRNKYKMILATSPEK